MDRHTQKSLHYFIGQTKMLRVYIFISTFSLCSLGFVNASVDDLSNTKCADNPTICMMNFLKLWEDVRVNETNASTVLLPILYYPKGSLLSLCELYSEVNDKCGLENCPKSNIFVGFVARHFEYVCEKKHLNGFLENYNCISDSIAVSNCTSLITGEPKIDGELYCPKVTQYFHCQKDLLKSCGSGTVDALKRITENYGCPFEASPDMSQFKQESTTSSVEDVTTAREVFELVTTSIPIIPDNSTDIPVVSRSSEVSETSTLITESDPKTSSIENITESVLSEGLQNNLSISSENLEKISQTEGSRQFTENETTTIITTTVPRARTRKPKRFRASNMTDCYTSILNDFGRFLRSSPSSSFVRFPLFGLKSMEIEVLCSKYEVSEECVQHFCVGNCRLPPVKTFVDGQLKEACKLRHSNDFEMEFACLQNTLVENPACTTFINTSSPNRCDGHIQFRNCILEKISEDCSERSVEILTKLQNGFGCRIGIINDDFESESSVEGSAEGCGSGQEPQEIEEHIHTKNEAVADDKLLTTENATEKPLQCSGNIKTTALSCLAPLLRLWTGIKENRKDTEAVFPIFRFSKIELLELCDSFANYRNCFRMTDSSICKEEPMVTFVEQHFGQVCTTQTIEASIRTHNCINFIDSKSLDFCSKFAKGDTLPGKRKCSRVRHYTKCLRKLVTESCGHLMLAQFDLIVDRFGC